MAQMAGQEVVACVPDIRAACVHVHLLMASSIQPQHKLARAAACR